MLERFERRSRTEVVLGVKLLAASRAPRPRSRRRRGYVQAQQRDGRRLRRPQVTAWATLGLVAAGARHGARARRTYLARQEPRVGDRRSRSSRWRARRAGDRPDDLLAASAAHTGRGSSSTRRSGRSWRCGRRASRRRRARAGAPAQRSAPRAAGRGSRAAPPTRTTPPPRCRRSARPACAARPIQRGVAFLRRHQNRGRRLRADAGPRLGHPVDRLGDPGAARRRARARARPPSAISRGCAARTAATATTPAT